MRKVVLLISGAILFVSIQAYGYGQLYIVKPHDTLWSISKKFYKDPFLWGKLWQSNTYINDPNLIFPGEILRITKKGLESYRKRTKITIKRRKYLSPVWFDGHRFYSSCESNVCIWRKRDFKIARLSFDTYSHVNVSIGDTVYLYTRKSTLPSNVYVYRKLIDYFDTSFYKGIDSIYIPVGEIRIEKRIRPGIFKGKITKAAGEISNSDVVSSVYPYEIIKGKAKRINLGNVGVKQIFLTQNELQDHLGFFLFFKADRVLPTILGKKVTLQRLNKGSAVPVPIGEGVVTGQYKNYISVFFSSINGLGEIPDITQRYNLR